MEIDRHGVMIGTETVGNDVFLILKAVGKLTHEDYQTITPVIDAALAAVRAPKIKALIDGTEWQGWELRAAWDDFRIGLKHGREFEKIAIYGNKGWQEFAARIGRWFMSGEMRYFTSQEEARAWLNSPD